MLQYHKVAAVAHGFRSSFRDWAAEETDHPCEVIEPALAHVVQSKVEAGYARSDLSSGGGSWTTGPPTLRASTAWESRYGGDRRSWDCPGRCWN